MGIATETDTVDKVSKLSNSEMIILIPPTQNPAELKPSLEFAKSKGLNCHRHHSLLRK